MSDGQMPLTHIKQATEMDEERIWRLAAAAEREACAKIADWAVGQCLQHARHPTTSCEEPECCEQRSMAKACENVAAKIRERGAK